MAGLIRCSCFICLPPSSRSSFPELFSGKPHLAGNFQSLLFKFGKIASPLVDDMVRQAGFHHPPRAGKDQNMLPDTEQKSKDIRQLHQMPSTHGKVSEWLSGLEESQRLRFLKMVFLFSNAFMLSAPPEALAETCQPENSFFNMPLLLLVALIGATVGGLLARQRRGELRRLNEQLRQINTALRRQAKIESYAPSLSYAPTGPRIPDNEVIVDPRKQELIAKLKTGKNFLRNQEHEKAFAAFKSALQLAQSLKDPIEEKKAARGLGASLQRQGKYREAINYHSMVLAISDREGEDSGNAEAYGAIADCYTELGDLEKAGKFYDQYIARLESD